MENTCFTFVEDFHVDSERGVLSNSWEEYVEKGQCVV